MHFRESSLLIRTDQPLYRRALTKAALRIRRFLGISDLARSLDDAHGEIDASAALLSTTADELETRVQMLEQEQLIRYEPLLPLFHQPLLQLECADVLYATQFADFATMH